MVFSYFKFTQSEELQNTSYLHLTYLEFVQFLCVRGCVRGCVVFFRVRVCACACMCVLCHLVNTSEGYVFMFTLAIALLEEFMSYLTAPS